MTQVLDSFFSPLFPFHACVRNGSYISFIKGAKTHKQDHTSWSKADYVKCPQWVKSQLLSIIFSSCQGKEQSVSFFQRGYNLFLIFFQLKENMYCWPSQSQFWGSCSSSILHSPVLIPYCLMTNVDRLYNCSVISLLLENMHENLFKVWRA